MACGGKGVAVIESVKKVLVNAGCTSTGTERRMANFVYTMFDDISSKSTDDEILSTFLRFAKFSSMLEPVRVTSSEGTATVDGDFMKLVKETVSLLSEDEYVLTDKVILATTLLVDRSMDDLKNVILSNEDVRYILVPDMDLTADTDSREVVKAILRNGVSLSNQQLNLVLRAFKDKKGPGQSVTYG